DCHPACLFTMKETDREAVATAVQRVAGMLQRPDQLDKVEQYRRREARKKASVEARLKAAIQSQLDGVRTGLSQLHNALNDVKDIQRSLADVSKDWRQSINTIESLKDVKDAVVRHSQLAAAVENLKNIFSVPEIVRETQDLIEQGALLEAHRKLMDLECSRDGLMYEQYRTDSGNTRDMTLIHGYFGSTQGLSDELAKQLWMVLQRSLVTVLRIIEREEKIDRAHTGSQKKLEGEDVRSTSWTTRRHKTLMAQCFPPQYDIFRRLLGMYHQALSSRMQELASEDLEANEIVSLLTCTEMMGNVDLAPEVDVIALEPLLSPNVVSELLDTYMSTLTSNIIAWLRKALETDKKDWVKETEPEADQDGYYQTTLPAIVFQMFEQNLQVAAQISEDLKTKVLVLCLQQMSSFLSRYRDETQLYKEDHLRDRQNPPCYVQYMVAIINNCQTFRESVVSLKRKYLKSSGEEDVSLSQPSMDGVLDAIADEGCRSLLEEVFLDLEQHLSELMTRKWLLGSNAVDTICVTVEDYFNDFAKIKKPYKKRMTAEAQRRVVVEYLRAVMQKRISFRSPEERKEGADRMVREAEQLRFLFRKLASGFGEDAAGYCDTITAVAEVIKLTDPSLLYLEVSTLVSKYPDIRDDHIGALLAVRGDASRDMKQTIIESLEQGPTQASPNYVPIFREIMVPSLNVAKLLK
uniref:Exocyst complex component 3 n=1 Tax=Rhinolophus ferrumequinum TaxID=59479 RepID=A0A671DPR4_RHIFE